MEQTHLALLAEKTATPDGMLTIDSSEFPKKGKESVIMTAAQAFRMVASVLPLRSVTPQDALEIVGYHIRRNDIAYKSHRKRAIESACAVGLDMSL